MLWFKKKLSSYFFFIYFFVFSEETTKLKNKQTLAGPHTPKLKQILEVPCLIYKRLKHICKYQES